MEENYFVKLSSINVNENKKKKKDLDYLSWAWAWAEVKKMYPNTTSKVYEREDGRIYWDDGKTAWVKVGVTVEGIEHIEYLPIMDFSCKSIKVENITSMEVNKAIQRGLTKAIARHGIGLYIYAGEDLPEDEEEKPTQVTTLNVKELCDELAKCKDLNDLNNFKTTYIKDFNSLSESDKKTFLTEANKKKSTFKDIAL